MTNPFPSLVETPRAFPLPSIPEDTVHYALHLPSIAPSSSSSPSPYSDPSALALLITTHIQSLLPSPWIWNKDSWELKVSSTDATKLEGTMRVGDAIDDEWLVVWLLRQVSEKWKELVIRFVLSYWVWDRAD
jgi:hypothetical protein